jgi:hypothetical protein
MRLRTPALLGSLAALATLVACAGTAIVEPSGFLGDYSQLKPGRGDQAQLIYIDPEADFSPYQRVLIEPVEVWQRAGGSDADSADLASLADDLGSALRKQLQLEFDLVDSPQPGTLRIRTAITQVRKSGASIEIEILDAESGRRLIAAADAKGEVDRPGESTDDWASAREAFEFWAQRARDRLAAMRSFDASEAEHDSRTEP